jgi:curved DNA-binding protein CbpA
MAIKRDPYRIMDIPPVATIAEIKAAYRKKSKMYHPDSNPDLKLDAKMSELVEAYNIISDEEKRKEYDNSPHFQIRRSRKNRAKKTTKLSSAPIKGKPTFKNSTSLLDRIKEIFTGPKKKVADVEYNPKEADIHFSLGVSLCDNPKFLDQAPNAFKKSVGYDPEHMDSYFNLAIVYYRLGQWADALIALQNVLSLEKDDQTAKMLIGLLKEE